MKIVRWSLGLLLLMPAEYVSAQAPQAAPPTATVPTAASASGQATQDAKPKKARVWDNDNIPKAGDEISVVGEPASEQSASSATPAAGADAGDKKEEEKTREVPTTDVDARIASAKEKLESLKKDLDLQQRRLDLDSQMYYSKPDYATDTEGSEQLETEKDAIAAKQDEVDAAQKELDALQAEFGGSNGGSSANSGDDKK
jgi:hypothetical protein